MPEAPKPHEAALQEMGGEDKKQTTREVGREALGSLAERGGKLISGAVNYLKDNWQQTKQGWGDSLKRIGRLFGGAKDAAVAGTELAVGGAIVGAKGLKAGAEYAAGGVVKGAKGAVEGAKFVGRKAVEANNFVDRKSTELKQKAVDGAKEKYNQLTDKGKELYAGARNKMSAAHDKFNGWRNERRMAKLEALKKDQEANKENHLKRIKEQVVSNKDQIQALQAQIISLNERRKQILKTPAEQLPRLKAA